MLFLILPVFAEVYTRSGTEYTVSESVTCGNGICEVMEFDVEKGKDKTVEIVGETYTFELLDTTKEERLDETGKVISYSIEYTMAVNGEEMTSEEIQEKIQEKHGFFPDIRAWAEDKINIRIYEADVDGCKTPDCFYNVELDVHKKWNLVPIFFLMEENFKTGTCKAQDFLVIYGYDSIKREYVELVAHGKSNSNLDSKLNDFAKRGELRDESGAVVSMVFLGYYFNSVWVYSVNECKLAAEHPNMFKDPCLIFEAFKDQVGEFKAFVKGWNFWTGNVNERGKSFDGIKGDCIIEKAYTFDSLTQSWRRIYTQPGPETAFIFKVTNSCSFGYPEIGPPALPD